MNEKQRVEGLLKEYGFAAKKSFGQNFLINEGIIHRIVNGVQPETFDTVIEIGPGLGALTLPLSQHAKHLVAVDADRDMILILKDILKEKKNVTLVESDFLRFDPDAVSKKENRLFVGNLPYNITSELFEYFLQKGFKRAGAMVQKEVADKLSYVPGKKENTALGAYLAEIGTFQVVTLVDRSSFLPAPKVDSAFVQIDWQNDAPYDDYLLFKAFFKDPNKNLRNCLLQSPKYKSLTPKMVEREPSLMAMRARQLPVNELVKLAREVREEALAVNPSSGSH